MLYLKGFFKLSHLQIANSKSKAASFYT
jgi:hypothetical protein